MLQAIATTSDSRLNEFVQHMQKAQACLERLLAIEADDTFQILPRKVTCAVCKTMDRLKISQDSEARKVFACTCKREVSRTQKLLFGLGLLIVILVSASLCRAQDIDAPKPKFLDKTNMTLLSTSAASIAMDGLSTQYFQRWGHRELNPIAKPFVKSRSGDALYMGASYSALVAGMYLGHRKGWHRLERILPIAVSGAEAYWTFRNYNASRTLKVIPSPIIAGVDQVAKTQ